MRDSELEEPLTPSLFSLVRCAMMILLLLFPNIRIFYKKKKSGENFLRIKNCNGTIFSFHFSLTQLSTIDFLTFSHYCISTPSQCIFPRH